MFNKLESSTVITPNTILQGLYPLGLIKVILNRIQWDKIQHPILVMFVLPKIVKSDRTVMNTSKWSNRFFQVVFFYL